MSADTRILRIHDHVPEVPLPEDAHAALHAVMSAHRNEMRAALAPFGIPLEDVALPRFTRCIRLRDLPA